ncbi:conserved unknown protein [Ectocarpus siliculosus]|uniref:Polymorphic outer membrane protein n=1 Tax=Ectocarpus siliculosus TaxID=2880 RepID=D7FUB6_ECTSI|nr:conserved unknown protein [Ectocarpus siliculosus]|eukprot:CBJ26186.1 conserved unknown protein [Ectocarpus siliculosus]
MDGSQLELDSVSVVGSFGPAVEASESQVTATDCTFSNNNGSSSLAGAIFVYLGNLTIGGDTRFLENQGSAIGVWNILNSFDRASITGKTTFSDNSADLRGGAIYASYTAFSIDGETSFINNRASETGGAIYMLSSTLAATGNTSVLDNVAPSGGAVDVFRGAFSTGGQTTFVENTSGGVGGALAISQDSTLSVSGLTTFLENKADNNGGMAFFSSGSLEGSGPVNTTACVFERNSADDGGAFYSAAGYDLVQDCSFQANFAALSGGALLHSGVLVGVHNTAFQANRAGEDGLAIMSLGIAENFTDVTFAENTFYCAPGQYGSDAHFLDEEVADTCRLEVVCSRCVSSPCEDDDMLDNGISVLEDNVVPHCKAVAVGVNVSGNAGTTLQTLDLESGYYRTSAESDIILECHREEACVGGSTAGEYCATGYQGAYCAACEEGYASGLQYSCKSCGGDNATSAIGKPLIPDHV